MSIVDVRYHEPEEFFTISLIQLAHDILNGIVQSWNDHMFDSIDTSVSGSDNVVEDHECCLKRR